MTTELPPLHTQDPTGRFSDRAFDYARYRPRYPREAIDLILDGLGEPTQLVVADIGAGTGISARLIAERGANLYAVEPNIAMRSAAEPHPLVTWLDGSAEQTGLANQSIDLVLCCQAFHWFEPEAALAEFHRILKRSGRVALIWNDRNLDDEFTQDYTAIIRKAADRQFFDRPDRKSATALASTPLFHNYRCHTVTHQYALDLNSLIGLALSASYIPKAGKAHDRLIEELQALHQHWTQAGEESTVFLSFQTNIYLADYLADVRPAL